MAPSAQCKLINDRKERKQEKGDQVWLGEMKERREERKGNIGETRKLLSTKGGHRCAEQKA